MATMYEDKHGTHTIQFRDGKKKRTLRIGQMAQRYADEYLRRIEHLIGAKFSGIAPPPEVSKWLGTLTPNFRERLVKVGLLEASAAAAADGQAVRLGEYLDNYVAMRTDIAERTRINYKQAIGFLNDHFGRDKPLAAITAGHADEWRLWLMERLGENTARRHCGRAKQFFRAAERKGLIAKNPFADMKGCSVKANKSREYFVSVNEAQQVLDACPDVEWRMLFALARFGGLRTPSESLRLRWDDIDWDRGRVRVTSPKTAHHEGKGERWIPLFPELRQYLQEGWDAIDSGEFVITRYRDQGVNLRTTLEKIIGRAGLTPWPKLWQNLRSTRETELAQTYPIHVVCAWMGNSPQVASKHYLQIRTEDFETAATKENSLSAAKALPKALPQVLNTLADDRTDDDDQEGEPQEFQGIQAYASACEIVNTHSVPPVGLEKPAKNIEKTAIFGSSAAKSAANGRSGSAGDSGGEGDSAELAALKTFLAVADRGRKLGARRKEKTAARLAKAIASMAAKLDEQTAAGAAEFLRVAARDPRLVENWL